MEFTVPDLNEPGEAEADGDDMNAARTPESPHATKTRLIREDYDDSIEPKRSRFFSDIYNKQSRSS